MRLCIQSRVCRIMGLEAVESSACEVVRRKDGVPAATYQPFRPDIIRMEKVEDIDQKLGWQIVEWVTCV
jgi:hypothetical protein